MNRKEHTNNSTPVAVATVIQVQAPTSAKPGDKALIGADGIIEGWVGGGCVQPAVVSVIDSVLTSNQPSLLRVAPDGQWDAIDGLTEYSSSCLGRGSMLLFIEPFSTQPTLCIMGESAVALSLAEQAIRMNLNVILQAPQLNNASMSAGIIVQSEYAALQSDYTVIATQGKGDKKAIGAALASQCQHIRMVVSERKLSALKEQLIADGMKPQGLSRLEGPAGIYIKAQLPNEIALSVLAEVIQLRRTSTIGPVQTVSATTPDKATQNDSTGGGCCGG